MMGAPRLLQASLNSVLLIVGGCIAVVGGAIMVMGIGGLVMGMHGGVVTALLTTCLGIGPAAAGLILTVRSARALRAAMRTSATT